MNKDDIDYLLECIDCIRSPATDGDTLDSLYDMKYKIMELIKREKAKK